MGKESSNHVVRVTAAILTNGGQVFIARRPPGDRLAGKWEFPGGKIEPGETPPACLAREMREEFALMVDVGEFFGVSRFAEADRMIELLAYRCNYRGGEIVPTVHAAYAWVPAAELDRYDFAPADLSLVRQLRYEQGIID